MVEQLSTVVFVSSKIYDWLFNLLEIKKVWCEKIRSKKLASHELISLVEICLYGEFQIELRENQQFSKKFFKIFIT